MMRFIRPLIESNFFFRGYWDNIQHIDHDLNNFRHCPDLYNQSIYNSCFWAVNKNPPKYKRWLKVQKKEIAPVVVTANIHTNYDYPDDAIFLGTLDEYDKYGKNTNYYKINDALEMAEIIAGAEELICTRSLPLVIAQSIGHPNINCLNYDKLSSIPN